MENHAAGANRKRVDGARRCRSSLKAILLVHCYRISHGSISFIGESARPVVSPSAVLLAQERHQHHENDEDAQRPH